MELEDKYLLDEYQRKAFIWLKEQDLGIDHDILAYWSKIITLSDLMSCISYVKTLPLSNKLKYIQKYLKTDKPASGNTHLNQEYITKISKKYPEMKIKVYREFAAINVDEREYLLNTQSPHKYFIDYVTNIL